MQLERRPAAEGLASQVTAKVTPPAVIFPPPPLGILHFVSGASAPADLRGLSRFSVPLGVSLAELSDPALDYLLGCSHMPLYRLFVDTSAFSEVEFEDGKMMVVAPISDDAWRDRVEVELRLAEAFGERAWVVAPDRIGSQEETLRRMTMWAEAMREVRARGAHVVVPLQRGAMSLIEFEHAAREALGLSEIVAGVTGNKDATSPAEFETWLRASKPTAIHLLGMGPRNPRLRGMLDLCRRLAPTAALTCDSNDLAALVGHTNGRGGGPRALTAWQAFLEGDGSEKAREDAVAMAFGPSRMLWAVCDEQVRLGLRPPLEEPPLQLGLFDGG